MTFLVLLGRTGWLFTLVVFAITQDFMVHNPWYHNLTEVDRSKAYSQLYTDLCLAAAALIAIGRTS